MFPKQLIVIYHISPVIDDSNNENMERDDEDDNGNPVRLRMILHDIIFNT